MKDGNPGCSDPDPGGRAVWLHAGGLVDHGVVTCGNNSGTIA